MKTVTVYTDGACLGNPGPGGWAAILEYNSIQKELSGGERHTTNNRMELTAAIKALGALKEPCEVILYSDSKYLCDAVNLNWLYSWQKNNWKKSDKKNVLNIDLWENLLFELKRHKVTIHWVKGHDGNDLNERCDALAVQRANEFKEDR